MRHTAPGLAAVAAATALLLTGCGGGSDAATTSQPAQPGAASSGASAPRHGGGPSTRGGDSIPAGDASPAAGGGTAHRDQGTSGSMETGSGRGAGGSSPSDDTSGSAAESFPLVDPGDYSYRAHGHADTALGDRDFDGKSHLTVTAPADDRRHATLRGEDGRTEQTLVGRRTGLYLADLEMSQQGFDTEFHPSSPVLLFPADAQVGDHWSWQMTSTDGDYTLHATLRYADDGGTATVSGRQVQTVTVKGTLVLEGDDFSMTLHQTDEAAAGGLVVHEHTTGDGTAYGTPVHTEADRRLISD